MFSISSKAFCRHLLLFDLSFVSYERPILDNEPQSQLAANSGFWMDVLKSSGFGNLSKTPRILGKIN